jgi:hypothetical protein
MGMPKAPSKVIEVITKYRMKISTFCPLMKHRGAIVHCDERTAFALSFAREECLSRPHDMAAIDA